MDGAIHCVQAYLFPDTTCINIYLWFYLRQNFPARVHQIITKGFVGVRHGVRGRDHFHPSVVHGAQRGRRCVTVGAPRPGFVAAQVRHAGPVLGGEQLEEQDRRKKCQCIAGYRTASQTFNRYKRTVCSNHSDDSMCTSTHVPVVDQYRKAQNKYSMHHNMH